MKSQTGSFLTNGATRVCHYGHPWPLVKDKIWQSIHHGDDGQVFNANESHPDNKNNSIHSRNHFHKSLGTEIRYSVQTIDG